jgi:uncharacterized protein YcfJ
MSRKYLFAAAAVGSWLASAAAFADHDRDSGAYDEREGAYDYARVVAVEPLRRQVRVSEPVRECWDETVPVADGPFSSNHIGGTLIGGLIGGVLGNQVGDGSGRKVARAAGAIIGGAIGHKVSQDRQRQRDGDYRVRERCETRYRDSYEERVDGYDVTYEYAGRRYLTRLPYDPGDRIRVQVDVTPAG